MPTSTVAPLPRRIAASPVKPEFAHLPPPPVPKSVAPKAVDAFAGDASERAVRLMGATTFVREMAKMLDLKHVPTVSIDESRTDAGHYDESSNHITLGSDLLSLSGKKARKILAHEMIHAWQNETGLLRWNLDEVGAYIEPPTGKPVETILNPLKLVQLIGYALQPSELHAELSRLVRSGLGLLPPPPW